MKRFQFAMSAFYLVTAVVFLLTVRGVSKPNPKASGNQPTGQAQSPPKIVNARMKGSKILIQGENFTQDTVVLINGQAVRTVIDSESPGTLLIAKNIKKATPMGAEVHLQVQSSGAQPSEPFEFFVGRTIYYDDAGQTITLSVGERVMLLLKRDTYEWTPSVERPAVLQKVEDPALVRGAQGIYQAQSPGTTKLNAAGDLPCSKASPPCAAPSLGFEVTIVVQ
jgi:hypothetical protein